MLESEAAGLETGARLVSVGRGGGGNRKLGRGKLLDSAKGFSSSISSSTHNSRLETKQRGPRVKLEETKDVF